MEQNSQIASNIESGQFTDHIDEREKHLFQKLLNRQFVSRDVGLEVHESLSFGQKLSDSLARHAGSWPFVIFFLLFLSTWIVLNSIFLAPSGSAFDPYPFILLNLFLSMLAAIQAPIILMSQNRQTATDRISASHDYEVNLKAELEVMSLHTKIDQLREDQLNSLIALHENQLQLLVQIRDILAEGSK